ncbi:MAG: hypothetical protein M1826_003832 [Phylliscum demangeonii]|nr:MAG: hypothetical protein M1826_003832 [Phylliscum demangeonii]
MSPPQTAPDAAAEAIPALNRERSASPAPPTKRSNLDQREELATASVEGQIAKMEAGRARGLKRKKDALDRTFQDFARTAGREIHDLDAKRTELKDMLADTEAALAETKANLEERRTKKEKDKAALEVKAAKNVAASRVAMRANLAKDMAAMQAAAMLNVNRGILVEPFPSTEPNAVCPIKLLQAHARVDRCVPQARPSEPVLPAGFEHISPFLDLSKPANVTHDVSHGAARDLVNLPMGIPGTADAAVAKTIGHRTRILNAECTDEYVGPSDVATNTLRATGPCPEHFPLVTADLPWHPGNMLCIEH